MKKSRKEVIILLLAIILFYGVLHLLGITCPIKTLTGVSCPGCGMTRAWISLIKLDIKSAFYYHPLFILPLIIAIAYLYRDRIPEKVMKIGKYIFIFLFFVVYIYRMANPNNDIVVFRPYESLFYKLWSMVFK